MAEKRLYIGKMSSSKIQFFKRFIALITGTSLLLLSACGTASGTAQSETKAANRHVTITLWTWQSTIKDFTSAFERSHPGIHVKVENVGTNDEEYLQLVNAITARSGIPDVVYIDNNAIQQFAVSRQLRNVDDLGFRSISKDFTPSSLDAVTLDSHHYGLPISAGPMVMFYNTRVFAKADIAAPPATWEEFEQDARKIAALHDGSSMICDTGDPGLFESLLWQAGTKPFSVKHKDISIRFDQPGAQKLIRMLQRLLDDRLIDTKTPTWSEDWYTALSKDSVGTILSGAWMSTTLKKNVKNGSGHWRVAPLPQYSAAGKAGAENGGGALVLPSGSDGAKVSAAYEFARWYAHEGGVRVNIKQNGIPPLKSIFSDKDYLAARDPYFGGQQTHRVFATAEAQVLPGWQYLPYMEYGNQIAKDSLGRAYQHEMSLQAAVKQWKRSLEAYGRQEGFTVR